MYTQAYFHAKGEVNRPLTLYLFIKKTAGRLNLFVNEVVSCEHYDKIINDYLKFKPIILCPIKCDKNKIIYNIQGRPQDLAGGGPRIFFFRF